jgi:hypothetical protein
MARSPSPTLIVFGTLHILGGVLGLLTTTCLSFYTVGVAVGDGDDPALTAMAAVRSELIATVPGYAFSEMANLGMGFLISALLTMAGVGLLLRWHLGRHLSNVYAILSLLVKSAMLIYMLGMVRGPHWDAVQQTLAIVDPAEAEEFVNFQTFSFYLSVTTNALLMIYPILVLILLNLPSVVAQLASEPSESDENDEEFTDRPRRRRRTFEDREDDRI